MQLMCFLTSRCFCCFVRLVGFCVFVFNKRDFQILFQISYFVSFVLTFFRLNCILFNDWIILIGHYFFTKFHVGVVMRDCF